MLGSSQKQQGSADSRRLTSAQQAVAAALMVVMKRAMKGGRAAAIAAQQTLVSNNPATQPFLMMLPDDGPFPTMQTVEHQASEQLLESLTKLAEQYAAAHCQPLKVFSRSVQCTTNKSAIDSLANKGRIYQRQQRLPQLNKTLAWLRNMTNGHMMAHIIGLRELGVPTHVASLTANFLQYYGMLQNRAHWNQPATEHRSDLDHLLPGRHQCCWNVSMHGLRVYKHCCGTKQLSDMQSSAAQIGAAQLLCCDATCSADFGHVAGALDELVEIPEDAFLHTHVLIKLVPAVTAALQAYQARATQCGQPFEHMVRLEAAVQGWCVPALLLIPSLLEQLEEACSCGRLAAPVSV